MATEPERPIEKLLRAAAQKRREEAGGPSELHPATRRLLQGEVGRQFARGAPERRPLWTLFAGLWPRVAVGAAILAVLGVAVWLAAPGMRSEKSATMLARNQATPVAVPGNESVTRGSSPPAAAPTTPPKESPAQPAVVTYADRAQSQPRPGLAEPVPGEKAPATDNLRSPTERAYQQVPAAAREAEIAASQRNAAPPSIAGTVSGGADRRLGLPTTSPPPGNASAAPAAPAPVAAAASAASTVAEDKSLKLKDSNAVGQALAFQTATEASAANRATVAPATAGTPTGFQAALFKAEAGPAVSQRYAQVTTGKKAKVPRPVLASFQVEQSGSELRIVDGDGSVYKGYITASDSMARTRAADYGAVPATAAARATKGAEASTTRVEADRLLVQNYFFRVAGTNRSLQKPVVFTGSLVPALHTNTLPPASTNRVLMKSAEALQTGSGGVLALPLSNARISGTVVVGSGKAVEIKAEPAGR